MRLALLLAPLGLAAGALPLLGEGKARAEAISYRCGDLVVIGRLETLAYEDVENENDLIGHGWITARVKVGRVLAGRIGRPPLIVEYFGHAPMRHDRDFVLVIGRATSGRNVVRSSDLIEGRPRPRLASPCEPVSPSP